VETVQHNNIKFQVWDLGQLTTILPPSNFAACFHPTVEAMQVTSSPLPFDTKNPLAGAHFYSVIKGPGAKEANGKTLIQTLIWTILSPLGSSI